ncbi:MAG: hypothetical protein RMX96_34810 [Nostoc sp. ChiSLP02]|nr:hypothetical protein [Nostoc sp. DedSLP05]MDZ8102306.1 hypothetical protein [Nostoc sp. DedSLP01]MDZ8189994.1 hypothetical protein [Nostoc sp. ChiSLP02]
MSNINNQTQDLHSIELVQDLEYETAATITGGALYLSTGYNASGSVTPGLTKGYASLGGYNNKVSWYQVTGNKGWYAYTGQKYTGKRYYLPPGTKGNLGGNANNNFESVLPA